ncbi:hypothetical protein tb265_44570 [Gemmatimonadetes bacterium T265]|nr:hypothetical protein tb265_44570 [Gemmatimonadetes bacterium T265]
MSHRPRVVTDRTARLAWLPTDLGVAASCLPAVAAALAAGILLDSPRSGAVAAGAAVTVGFGAFKHVHHSRAFAMLAATAGICVSTALGTLAGRSDATMIAAVLLWALAAGLLPAVTGDLGWVGQQCAIFLMVAGNFPGGPEHALARTALVLGGSVVQVLVVEGLRRLVRPPLALPAAGEVVESARAAVATVAREVRARSDVFRRAARVAVVLAAAVETWRLLHLPNGYWMAMTALLLVRPNLRATFGRAAERVAGTVAGAGLATLLAHTLPRVTAHPSSHWVSAGLTAAFALLALALQQGNRLGRRAITYPGSYGVFAACLTAYVVYLLHYGGLEQRGVAVVRVLLTALGGLFALAVHLPFERALHVPRIPRLRRHAPGHAPNVPG